MSIAEFVYTVLLKPKPLRKLANFMIQAMIPAKIRYGQVEILLNPRDPVVSGALAFRQYERDELAYIYTAVKPGMVALDVGANIGLYTSLFASQVGPSGHVVALEPDPDNYSFLTKSIAHNRLQNVHTLQAAAAREAGEMTLYTSSENRGDNRLYNNDLANGAVRVKVICLDEALPQLGVEKLDFIKIDVQGFEGEVLAGLEKTIRSSPQIKLLMEFWPSGLSQAGCNPLELLQRLKSWGLELRELKKGGNTAAIEDFVDFIARYPGRKYTNLVVSKGVQV